MSILRATGAAVYDQPAAANQSPTAQEEAQDRRDRGRSAAIAQSSLGAMAAAKEREQIMTSSMSKLTKYSAEAASDIDEHEIWFWDTLSDLHEQAKDIIAEHMARLKGK